MTLGRTESTLLLPGTHGGTLAGSETRRVKDQEACLAKAWLLPVGSLSKHSRTPPGHGQGTYTRQAHLAAASVAPHSSD